MKEIWFEPKMQTIPSERTLSHMRWTEQRVRAIPWVTWQEGLPYVGARRLVLPETVDELLLSEYHNVTPSIGYLSWFALLSAKYVGLRRKDVAHFLSLRKTQWLTKPQHSR
jgi:hypothetical protein